MFILKKFCGFDIRTGGVIIGWLNLGVCIYKLINTIIDHVYDPIPATSSYTSIPEYYKNLLKFNVYFEVGAILLFVAVNAILLYGIHKSNKAMLIPWLIMKMIGFAILTIMWIIAVVSLLAWKDTAVGIVVFVIGMPLCGLPWHCWRCVFTLYKSYNLSQSQFNPKALHEEID